MRSLHLGLVLLVLALGFLEERVEVGGDVHVLSLVQLEVFEVANEHGVHTHANNVGNDVKDSEGKDDGETEGNSGKGTVLGIQDGNSDDGAQGSEKGLSDEEDESGDGVHDDRGEEVAGDQVEALTRSVAEAVSVHCDVDVGELVDVLDNSLDAREDALDAGDQAHEELVLGVGLLGELQKEVHELDDRQHESSEGQRAKGGGDGMEQGCNRIFSWLSCRDNITGEVPASYGTSHHVLVNSGEERGNPEKGKHLEEQEIADFLVEVSNRCGIASSNIDGVIEGDTPQVNERGDPEGSEAEENGNDDSQYGEEQGVVLNTTASFLHHGTSQSNLLAEENDEKNQDGIQSKYDVRNNHDSLRFSSFGSMQSPITLRLRGRQLKCLCLPWLVPQHL